MNIKSKCNKKYNFYQHFFAAKFNCDVKKREGEREHKLKRHFRN